MLPPSFTSLYRLFLRTSSAAVLHHPAAKIALRKSWRPIFEGAVLVIRKLQNAPTLNTSEQEAMEGWLIKWEGRSMLQNNILFSNLTIAAVDNTLSLLYTSASSRGLPHDLTRNLASLQRRHIAWSKSKYNRPASAWDPKLPPSKYQVKTKPRVTITNNEDGIKVEEKAWNALGEVVRMAEGRDMLVLGRANWKNKQRSRWKD
jgi:hypothetical protein